MADKNDDQFGNLPKFNMAGVGATDPAEDRGRTVRRSPITGRTILGFVLFLTMLGALYWTTQNPFGGVTENQGRRPSINPNAREAPTLDQPSAPGAR